MLSRLPGKACRRRGLDTCSGPAPGKQDRQQERRKALPAFVLKEAVTMLPQRAAHARTHLPAEPVRSRPARSPARSRPSSPRSRPVPPEFPPLPPTAPPGPARVPPAPARSRSPRGLPASGSAIQRPPAPPPPAGGYRHRETLRAPVTTNCAHSVLQQHGRLVCTDRPQALWV